MSFLISYLQLAGGELLNSRPGVFLIGGIDSPSSPPAKLFEFGLVKKYGTLLDGKC
jgi:hypothetical protein